MNETKIYHNARIAVRGGKAPEAYLNLGILYAKGIGTHENHALANYFYEKALAMGCREAEGYIEREYELGQKDIVAEVERAVAGSEPIAPGLLLRLKRRIEKERAKHNYGILSKLRQHLHLFYPDYDRERATADILADRDSADADIYYSLCTSDNEAETDMDWQESLLLQLYAPVMENVSLQLRVKEFEKTVLFDEDEETLIHTLQNMTASYHLLCKRYNIPRQELTTAESLELLPFIKAQTLTRIRKQAFGCLLSLGEVFPVVKNDFLNHLECDDSLLSICERPMDQTLRSFLISYIELNISVETVGLNYQALLSAYRENERNFLADLLNECVGRLTEAGIEHHLPLYAPDNLPPIEIGK